MYALVHKGSSAVHLPGTLPVAGCIIFRTPVELHIYIGTDDFPKISFFDDPFDKSECFLETVLAYDLKFNIIGFTGFYYLITLISGKGHRFFHYYMLSCFCAHYAELLMQSAWSTDAYNIDSFIFQHCFCIIEGSYIVLC